MPRAAMATMLAPASGARIMAETAIGGTSTPMHTSFRRRDTRLHDASAPGARRSTPRRTA